MLMINSVPRAWCMDPDGVYSELSSSSSPFELAMALVAFGSPEHDDYVSDFTVSPTSDSPVRRHRISQMSRERPTTSPCHSIGGTPVLSPLSPPEAESAQPKASEIKV